MSRDTGRSKQPAQHAFSDDRSPISGTAPPASTRWQPGQSGNPSGRKNAGASIRNWINDLSHLTEPQLRKLAANKRAPWTKRAAAERMLRTLESGDLADFTAVTRGEKTLDELRAAGVNTAVVKKVKVKRRTIRAGDEVIGEEVEGEVELHDRAGDDFDRILDRTIGKPAPADLADQIQELRAAIEHIRANRTGSN